MTKKKVAKKKVSKKVSPQAANQQPAMFNLNGKDYDFNALDAGAQNTVRHIMALQTKVSEKKFELEELELAHSTYVNLFNTMVK